MNLLKDYLVPFSEMNKEQLVDCWKQSSGTIKNLTLSYIKHNHIDEYNKLKDEYPEEFI